MAQTFLDKLHYTTSFYQFRITNTMKSFNFSKKIAFTEKCYTLIEAVFLLIKGHLVVTRKLRFWIVWYPTVKITSSDIEVTTRQNRWLNQQYLQYNVFAHLCAPSLYWRYCFMIQYGNGPRRFKLANSLRKYRSRSAKSHWNSSVS